MPATTATVVTLTASVQTLLVGTRQVTMSVYTQLDTAPAEDIEAFGRVRPRDALPGIIYIVGRHRETGALVRAAVPGTLAAMVDALGIDAQRAFREHRDAAAQLSGPLSLLVETDGGYQTIPFWQARVAEAASTLAALTATMRQEAAALAELPLIVLAGLT